MPKITDARRAERRMQILRAAWVRFQRDGLHQTSMRDIIAESGLSAGAVYGYFADKDALIAEAVATSLGSLGESLAALLASEPPLVPAELVARIAAAIDALAIREGYDLRRIALLGWAEAQRNPALAAGMRGFYGGAGQGLAQVARRWRAAGVIAADADPEAVAAAILALSFGYVVHTAVVGDLDPPAIARGLAGLAGTAG